jgi:hypothetical protein
MEYAKNLDAIYREIGDIGAWSEHAAIEVLANQERRHALAAIAEAKAKRLVLLVDRLEREGRAAYERCSDAVSESLLDLEFVRRPTQMFSFRLAQARARLR